MRNTGKKEIKDLILKKIERTRRKIVSYEEMTAPIAPENSIGRISRMDAINSKSVAEAGLREAQKVLSGLEYMLINIEKPDFGKCKKCGADIPVQRMLLVPHSPYCVKCSD